MSQIKVVCDSCKREFGYKKETQRIDDETEKHFFNCAHCGHEHIVYYTDSRIREEMRKQRNLFERLIQTKNEAKQSAIAKRIEAQKQKIGDMLKALRERIEAQTPTTEGQANP